MWCHSELNCKSIGVGVYSVHMTTEKKKIVIIGAGFAGLTAVRRLAGNKQCDVSLIAPNTHFEYYPGLYRIVSDHIPFEVFVPMRYLIPESVTHYKTTVISMDPQKQIVRTQSGDEIPYDSLVIATGTEVSDFGIIGVREYAHFVTSLTHLLQAKQELISKLQVHVVEMNPKPFTILVAGAGPTGVELTGELSEMVKRFTQSHPNMQGQVQIKMIQRDLTVLPQLPKKVQEIATKRLTHLGVELLLGQTIQTVQDDTLQTDIQSLPYDMFFWAAGSTQVPFIKNNPHMQLSPRKKVVVDGHLRAQGLENVYVCGDNAETQFSGLAQIAEQDGMHVATVLSCQINQTPPPRYVPRKPIYVIPIGDYFGILGLWGTVSSGFLPWLLRYAVDMRFFFFNLSLKDFLHISLHRKLK